MRCDVMGWCAISHLRLRPSDNATREDRTAANAQKASSTLNAHAGCGRHVHLAARAYRTNTANRRCRGGESSLSEQSTYVLGVDRRCRFSDVRAVCRSIRAFPAASHPCTADMYGARDANTCTSLFFLVDLESLWIWIKNWGRLGNTRVFCFFPGTRFFCLLDFNLSVPTHLPTPSS